MKIRDWLIPQEKAFFDFLENQIGNVIKGARHLKSLTENYCQVKSARIRMKKIEHDGDVIVHDFIINWKEL